MTETILNSAEMQDHLKEKYMEIYDDAAKLFREACLVHNEQRINQNKAIMSYLDRVLSELGEA